MRGMKKARKQAGLTQVQAAELSGIPLPTLRRWEQGVNEPDIASINLLADLYKTTTDVLLDSKFANSSAVVVTDATFPVFGRIAAGTAREALRSSNENHWVSPDLKRKYPDAFWLVVSGNSMNRLFPDGSLVLVDPNTTIRDGDVGVVFVNGDDATLKRVFFEGETVRLHPESYDPEYRDRIIDSSDPDAPDVRLVGRVVTYTAPDNWRA